jgi:hypothetical protein
MITSLTPEQAQSLATFRDYGLRIGLSTEPCDRDAAADAVRRHYAACELNTPMIVWLDGPLHGAIAAHILGLKYDQVHTQVRDQVYYQVRDQLYAEVRDQVYYQVRDQLYAEVRAQVYTQVRDQMRAQVRDQVLDQVYDQVYAQVRDQVYAQVRDQMRAQMRAQVYTQALDQVHTQVRDQVYYQVRDQVYTDVYAQVGRAIAGSQWADVAAQIRCYQSLGVSFPHEANTLVSVIENCGWLWAFDGLAILTERPHILCRDDQKRLHCEGGPAIAYRDGTEVYAWHGQRVPAKWLMGSPPTAAQALRWKNTDQRAAACEIIGWDKILDELDARVIEDSGDPAWGRLVEVDLPDSPKERFLDVLCGTGRRFALPVPPTTTTVDAAQSALYGGLPASLLRHSVKRT